MKSLLLLPLTVTMLLNSQIVFASSFTPKHECAGVLSLPLANLAQTNGTTTSCRNEFTIGIEISSCGNWTDDGYARYRATEIRIDNLATSVCAPDQFKMTSLNYSCANYGEYNLFSAKFKCIKNHNDDPQL